MKNTIYRITINNWESYNAKSKPGHPCIMLSKRFLDDAKIQTLPLGGKVLFLGLLLRRGDVRSTFIEATHKDLVTLSGGSGQVVSRLMRQLEQNQLLSYEILNNVTLNEIKLSEVKLHEDKLTSQPPQKTKGLQKVKRSSEEIAAEKADKEANRKIWESYFNAYRIRYGVEPVRNGTVNAQVAQLRSRLGVDDAIKVVQFYLRHNDSFYLKKTHSLGLCLRDAETLRTQMMRGKPITQTMVRSFEKTQSTQETLDQIAKEGI